MKGPEAKLEAKFRKKITQKGGLSMKFVSPGRRGVTDRLVVVPFGLVIFTEIKNGNKELDPLQEIFRKDVVSRGQPHEVIRFEEDIDNFIEKYFWHLM